MARKARQRISYGKPPTIRHRYAGLDSSAAARQFARRTSSRSQWTSNRPNSVDPVSTSSDQSRIWLTNGCSYSGGRDGLICAWSLDLDLDNNSTNANDPFASPEDITALIPKSRKVSAFHKQVQAHTHWINDILLAQNNSALVSASSDITVKVWRPDAYDNQTPTTIGLHSDYVKCLASPGPHSDWVASGGLDHKIRLWDLNGGGEKLGIDVGENEANAKGSVYALSVRGPIMASGGPESIVRLWDPKSGKRVTNFVGHTDNIRDILINEDGDTVMTASSDQSIKVWSITAGRCMYTLTVHNDSVWSLYSDHPQLSLFYSSDRSGLVAKTDVRGCEDMDEGLSLAVAQEQEGCSKIVVAGDYFWTGTSSSSINRWRDVDTTRELQSPEELRKERHSSVVSSRSKVPSPPLGQEPSTTNGITDSKIPLTCVLRISNSAPMPGQKPRDIESSTIYSGKSRKMSEAIVDTDLGIMIAYHQLPDETIEGQNGLIKHVLLNDRRRVLTLDTAGEVTMWDLLTCLPIKSYGKRHLEDVTPEVNPIEAVANWCGVDTRTGRLAVNLEENYCFDAEMYADEWNLDDPGAFREDQRINLGRWVLRFLFAKLIDEELVRDATYRRELVARSSKPSSIRRENAPPSISLPPVPPKDSLQNTSNDDDSLITPKPVANGAKSPTTPGLSIGLATPQPNDAATHTSPVQNAQSSLASTVEEGTSLEKGMSQHSAERSSTDKLDYFNSSTRPKSPAEPQTTVIDDSTTMANQDASVQSPTDGDKDEKTKEGKSLFGKKFRMNFPKTLGGRTSTDAKPMVVDEKAEESDKSSEKEEKHVEDNFLGTIQKIRYEYAEHLQNNPTQQLPAGVIPSLLSETPMLRHPLNTIVIIQEEQPDSGGVADLYRGTVSSVGQDADLIEKSAPMWLGDLLLRNQLPAKEIAKVSFILHPYQDSLPSIAPQEGNNRLNANRMLRAKKVLAYVAERIETPPAGPDPNALKPEEYLELYCHDQVNLFKTVIFALHLANLIPKLVDHNTTLATLRAHIWKTGGDVILHYKSSGRRPELDELVKKQEEEATQQGTAKTGPVINSHP